MRGLLMFLVALLLAAPAHAQGGDEGDRELVVGIYAPDILFASALARTGFAQQIASQLAGKTGLKFAGRGFATRADFEQQVKQGRVQFAVISAQVQVQRDYPAFAQGQADGKSARSMVLVTREAASIGALKGATIAGVGKGERGFVMNYLLQGQVAPTWFKFKPARDVQAALGQVKLGRAGAALTFSGDTAGLNMAFTSRPAPLPVFVQTDQALAADVAAKVRGAISGVSVNGAAFSGFGPVDGKLLAAVRGASNAALKAPGTDPVLAPARAALPPVPEFIDRSPPPVVLSQPTVDLTAPPPPKDLF